MIFVHSERHLLYLRNCDSFLIWRSPWESNVAVFRRENYYCSEIALFFFGVSFSDLRIYFQGLRMECEMFFSHLAECNIPVVVRLVRWRHLFLVQFMNHRIWIELKEKCRYNTWYSVYTEHILIWYLLTVWCLLLINDWVFVAVVIFKLIDRLTAWRFLSLSTGLQLNRPLNAEQCDVCKWWIGKETEVCGIALFNALDKAAFALNNSWKS